MESTELMALSDSELEEVAGGCGGRRHGRGGRGDLLARIAELDLNVDIDITIINFVGNVIQAVDGSAVAIEIDQGE